MVVVEVSETRRQALWLRGRFFEVFEVTVKVSELVGIVSGRSGEIGFEAGDALLEGLSTEPLATDAGVVGIKFVGVGDLVCGSAVQGVDPKVAGGEKMSAGFTGIELRRSGDGGPHEPEGALAVLNLTEGGLEDGRLGLRDERLLDEVVRILHLLLAEEDLNEASGECRIVGGFSELLLIERDGMVEVAVKVGIFGRGCVVGAAYRAGDCVGRGGEERKSDGSE
jgi:hypothetical protein